MSKLISSKLSYRSEIDGLRAIAVISVIFYHAQILIFGKDWFQGGYIGVDIFFVISGYLITRIILSELHSKNHFSILNFYEQRARRILPMLFLVIFVFTPYAWLKFIPSDFIEYAGSVLSSLFFSSNFFFYLSTTEYGSDSALLKPFLHTWSLGVEEQFYLIFPFIAILFHKYFRSYFFVLLVLLTLFCFFFAVFMQIINSNLNFYFPFSRFWELTLGSMLAYKDLTFNLNKSGIKKRLFPVIGLCLICYSILFFNGNTPHPSFHTLIPIIGVALIIMYASKDDFIGRLLGSKIFVWIGLISYSAYLWHFPIFAFSRIGKVSNNIDKFEWILMTLGLSIISFFLIEKPFRNKKTVSKKSLLIIIFTSLFLISAFMISVIKSEGFWSRYTGEQQKFIKYFNKAEFQSLDHPLSLEGLEFRSNKLTTSCNMRIPHDACRYGNEKLVFLGDSHVGQYERAFIDEFKLGFISFNYEQCPFVSDQLWFGNVAECSYINEERFKIIESFNEEKIFIIAANYSQFRHPKRRVDNPIIDGRSNRRNGELAKPGEVWKSYFKNIEWLVSKGHKVVLIRSKPNKKIEGSEFIANNSQYLDKMNFPSLLNDSKPSKIKIHDDKEYFDHSEFPIFDSSSVLVIDPINTLCDIEKDICWDVKKDYGPLYNAGNHLSYLGARLVAESTRQLMTEIGWLQNKPPDTIE